MHSPALLSLLLVSAPASAREKHDQTVVQEVPGTDTPPEQEHRARCVQAAEQWLSQARGTPDATPAGGAAFDTACGLEQAPEARTVTADEVTAVEAMLARWKAPEGASPGTASIAWVRIAGGTFQMGRSSGTGNEAPVHTVQVSSFELMRTEVTVAQYRACVDAEACTAPNDTSHNKGCNWGHTGREDHPINCVDWDQAQAFARWAGGRLPTEAEWEYAARSGGQSWPHPWGDAPPTCDRAILNDGGDGCGRGHTWPVCSKPQGNSTQGLCDLAGNAWEWTQDAWHETYSGAPADGTAWEGDGALRVVRGGSWDYVAPYLRVSHRGWYAPSFRYNDLGFRLARSWAVQLDPTDDQPTLRRESTRS